MQDLPQPCEGKARIRAQRGARGGEGPNDIADTGRAAADDAVLSLGRPNDTRMALGKESDVAMQHLALAAVMRVQLERAISVLDRRRGPLVSEDANPRILRRIASADIAHVVGARVVEDGALDVAVARREHALDAFAQKLAAALNRRDDACERRTHLMINSRLGGGADTRSNDSARDSALPKPDIRNQAAEKIIWDEERHHVQARVKDEASVALPGEVKQ
jgi:hypothetical protein